MQIFSLLEMIPQSNDDGQQYLGRECDAGEHQRHKMLLLHVMVEYYMLSKERKPVDGIVYKICERLYATVWGNMTQLTTS